MRSTIGLSLPALLVMLCLCSVSCGFSFSVSSGWDLVDYQWPSPEDKQAALMDGSFIPENNAITGVKMWQGETFVTVPRWRPGVPSTLNKVVMEGGKPVLQPYPSWEMNQIGNSSALQYTQSFEIDSRGWLWALDVGRYNILGYPFDIVNGQPKLVIWDIPNNCLIKSYSFPQSVVPNDNTFLNDIVVDETRGFAYMTSTWANGALVVYDMNNDQSRIFLDDSLKGNATGEIVMNGQVFDVPFPSDGIALSHDGNTLYYCALSRPQLYSVPTMFLRNMSLPDSVISQEVTLIGDKGFSDGMTMDEFDRLWYGSIEEDAVRMWNTSQPLSTSIIAAQSNSAIQWSDTFGFDTQTKSLVWTTNKLARWINNRNQFPFDGSDGYNFRILSMTIGANSYLSGTPNPPSLPCEQ